MSARISYSPSAFAKKNTQAGGIAHTDLADINELVCFLTIVSAEVAAELCDGFSDIKSLKKKIIDLKKIKNPAQGYAFDENDINAIDTLIKKLNKVVTNPESLSAARLKAIQGYNMGIVILDKNDIQEVFWTNTKGRLDTALKSIKYSSKFGAILTHPADLMIVVNDEPIGLSLKASFSSSTDPTICNIGMRSVQHFFGVLPTSVGITCSSSDVEVKDHLYAQQLEIDGEMDASILDVEDLKSMILELFHIQSGNLPYCIVSAKKDKISYINMEQLKEFLETVDILSFKKKNKKGKTITTELQVSLGKGKEEAKLILSYRLKKAGSKTTTLKLNIVSKNNALFKYCGADESLKGGMKLRTLQGRKREYEVLPLNTEEFDSLEIQENVEDDSLVNEEEFDDIISPSLVCDIRSAKSSKSAKSAKSPKKKSKRTKKRKKQKRKKSKRKKSKRTKRK